MVNEDMRKAFEEADLIIDPSDNEVKNEYYDPTCKVCKYGAVLIGNKYHNCLNCWKVGEEHD